MIDAIIGAGAAGMSLALMLGGDVKLYEKEKTAGGLCRSTNIDGFTFDTGPHILGGIPDAVDWIVESTRLDFVHGETSNVGYINGGYVPHPFVSAPHGEQYMAKMWKTLPSLLQLDGLGAQHGRRPGGVAQFRYPKRGGYQAITDAWAEQLDGRITYGCEVAAWDGDAVWTTPTSGRYNNLGLVTIGFTGAPAPKYTAIYLPESWTPFHRLSFPSNFAPSNAPEDCWSVQGEVSFRFGEGHPGDPVDLLLATIDHLAIMGDIVTTNVQLVSHAYPVPVDEKTDGKLRHGRTGAHRYLNLDGVVDASRTLAQQLA